jgi:hypothetical protein
MSPLEEFRHIERLMDEEKEAFFEDLGEEEESKIDLSILLYDADRFSFHHKGLRRSHLLEGEEFNINEGRDEQEKYLKVIFRHLRFVALEGSAARKNYKEPSFESGKIGKESNLRDDITLDLLHNYTEAILSELKSSLEHWVGDSNTFRVDGRSKNGFVDLKDVKKSGLLSAGGRKGIDEEERRNLFDDVEKRLGLRPGKGDTAYTYPILYAGQYQGFIYIFLPKEEVWSWRRFLWWKHSWSRTGARQKLRELARQLAVRIFQAKAYSFEKAILEGESSGAAYDFFDNVERVFNVVGGVVRLDEGSKPICYLKKIQNYDGVAPYRLETHPSERTPAAYEEVFEQLNEKSSFRIEDVPDAPDGVDELIIEEAHPSGEGVLEGLIEPSSKILFRHKFGGQQAADFCFYFYRSKEELEPESHQIRATLARMLETAERAENLRKATRRSAVSTVMSRNMSHNVGSHVLANLSNSDDLEESLGGSSGSWGWPVAEFNNYLRTRMDFIADVSTSSPAASTPIALYQDVFYPFAHKEEGKKSSSRRAGQHLLLEHISGIEDLGVENLNLRANVDGEDATEDDAKDVPFSSPNGLLGAHALYVIVENIIRNSAKHAYDSSEQDGFDLTIDVNEAEGHPGLVEVSVYDSLGNGGKTLKDGTPLPESQNDLIGEDIIEDDGSLNYDGWGVREMKICAAYLRGIAPQNLDKGFDPSLLEARAFERPGQPDTKDLGYTFYLQRPKEVFILDPSGALDATVEEKKLTRAGIMHATDEKNVEAAFNEGVEHHVLIVIGDDKDLRERVKENANALPLRRLFCNPGDDLYETLEGSLVPNREDGTDKATKQRSKSEGSSDAKHLISQVWKAWHHEQRKSAGYVNQLLLRAKDAKVINGWDDTAHVTVEERIDEDTVDEANRSVVYDRHGVLLWNNETEKEFDKERYEAIEGVTPAKHLIANPPESKLDREKLALEIIESGSCGVMILDERIQSLLQGKEEPVGSKRTSFTLPVSETPQSRGSIFDEEKSFLEMMNVWVPGKDHIDLDYPKRKEDELIGWVQGHLEDADFLVVHLGVLEKLYGDDLAKLYEKAKGNNAGEGIVKLCEDHKVEIIVTSGRGRPPQAVEMGARFLHYSQVAEHIVEDRSKYHFCRALFSARRLPAHE